MALRSALFLLLIALSLVSDSSAGVAPTGFGLVINDDDNASSNDTWVGTTGAVGELVGEDEEFGLESESTRRSLRVQSGGRRRFISYGALEKNRVPCSRRGRSYYNCNSQGRANPYTRGCSAVTRCARVLD